MSDHAVGDLLGHRVAVRACEDGGHGCQCAVRRAQENGPDHPRVAGGAAPRRGHILDTNLRQTPLTTVNYSHVFLLLDRFSSL
jgi:hypothetical protein